jgi:hypothetical protein
MEEQAKKGAVAVLNGDEERFALEPMNPYDRRLVHNYLQDNFPELSSDSEGEGEERHIVISYRGLDEDAPDNKKAKRAPAEDSDDDFEGDFDGDEEDEFDDSEEEKAEAVKD